MSNQKTANEAPIHGLLECKTRSFTIRLTVFYNSDGFQCNLNQQNINFKTIKIREFGIRKRLKKLWK